MKLLINKIIFNSILLITFYYFTAWAQSDGIPRVIETERTVEIQLPSSSDSNVTASTGGFDPLKYTLGPDDAVEISVMCHPEFSGVYPINKEGKLQYKFVGDIEVNGLTKAQLEQKIKDALSVYVHSPEVNVTVTEYRSKVIYIIGEVAAP